MRVPATQFGADAIHHFLEGKQALFPADLRLEHHLQQQVAQLIGMLVRPAGINGVNDLVALLNQVLLQRFQRLFAVPGTAAFTAHFRHDIEQVLEGIGGHGKKCKM